ncbi:TlpA disulfide reductase family protein [Niabella yanshanensis]|uniref:TlpA disulfide reductase family protein n=1 Tax=Niabella yanshanensis TaxID=577386 RepID=A0ABZ0WDH0_9BACT|nr:TlpA disulfide reductase family protein [Niabella yanshanensis]WQD40733.1 TlpA disulfide reductase family protein [Niabella yanshanensis]
MNLDKFEVIVNDGINRFSFTPKERKYWRGKLYAPFAYLEVMYSNNDSTYLFKQCFFKEKDCYINIIKSVDENEYFSIDETRSSNITSYAEVGGAALDSFTKVQFDIWRKFVLDNNPKIGKDAEVTQKLMALSDSMLFRRLAFIKSYPSLYISSWIFSTVIAKSDKIAAETLLKLYNDLMPDSYKNTRAGMYTEDLIQNKINIASKAQFPTFSVVDTKGNLIESLHLRGKYVLVQIWASWCKPCIEELPMLTAIHNKYKEAGLELISFSIDEDSTAFKKAIDKYAMNWKQILDSQLYNSLGGGGIPKIYLLDKLGVVIYDRESAKDFDLVLLSKLLSERLDN